MIISPKYDDFVKEMFRNETVRRHFIGDVLGIGQERIRSVQLRNPFLGRRYRKKKLGILDIVVELNDSEKINIELQVKMVREWDKRELFYLAKLYTDDLLAGMDYRRLKRCVGISILDFNLTEREEYHSVYRLRDEKGHAFTDLLEIHVIELKKEVTGHGEVEDWIRFFNIETEADMKMIKSKTKNPGILEAINALRVMSMNSGLRLRYEAYVKQVADERAREGYVWDQGREAGLKEGVRAGKVQGIEEGKAQGIVVGKAEGIAVGKAEGEQLLAALMERLIADNRMEDVKLAASDEQVRRRLYREYGIEDNRYT